MTDKKVEKRKRIHRKIRAKVQGTKDKPRISVYKSNRELMVQFIDDVENKTLLAAASIKMKGKTKTERSRALGESLAKQAVKKGFKKVVFDRGGFIYTGRISALAEGLRAGGLEF